MTIEQRFSYEGTYRVQSRFARGPATLCGHWHPDDPTLLAIANNALAGHPLGSPCRSIVLRTAVGAQRSGIFDSCPDVLYKQELFSATPGSPGLPAHILDLDKAINRWIAIGPVVLEMWSKPESLAAKIGSLGYAIRHEYFFHEVGHLIGVDIDSKMRVGHFRPCGRVLWPLVYAEEARADLHAMAIAGNVLAPSDAAAVFLYHIAIRFGVHRLGFGLGPAPYGLVPFLLFSALNDLGGIGVEGSRVFLTTTTDTELVSLMRACGEWAAVRVTEPELDAQSPLDRAMVGARWVRACLEDDYAQDAFARVAGWVA